jgi:hypothetical protein
MIIKINTPVEKPPVYTFETKEIKIGSDEYKAYCQMVGIDSKNISGDYYKVAQNPVFDTPIKIKVQGELDAKLWMKNSYYSSGYKQDIEIVDKNNQKYVLVGCFPTNIEENDVTLMYDYFVINNKESN